MELIFDQWRCATTTTKSGKTANIYENDRNICQIMYQVIIDGKTVCTRCGLAHVQKLLETN